MNYSAKRVFKDDWLAQALLYYQIIDSAFYEEMVQRFSDKNYLFDVMVENDYLQPADIADFVENALKIKTVDLKTMQIEQKAIEMVSEDLCRKYLFVPIKITDKEIHVASFNPSNLNAEQEIEKASGKYVKTFFAFKDQVEEKINAHYSPDKIINSLVGDRAHRSKIRIPGEETVANPAPVVKLVNQIFADALDDKASDIHIEPKETVADVRVRVDGVLRNQIEVPRSIYPSLVSRIKIISDLDIAESRKPQDGKAKIYVDDVDVDLRVSILPTNYGEKVVIRILDKRNATVSLDQMGIRGRNRDLLEKCFQFKQGMVLVTGPTGSGKSTTLYAAINRIKSTANNILTVEDPIEYMMDGINQVQVNVKAGVTFASALRSFLRQDPDVILVGEIRDSETAEIAIQAAQTGHLVLSTLHTNDTFATITRLQDMGVDKFKITESLQAIVAQRLVRRLCPDCKEKIHEDDVDPKLYTMVNQIKPGVDIYQAKGCPKCNYLGYKGRIGIYEILILDQKLKEKINTDLPLTQLRAHAKKNGFMNLFEDAVSLIAEGITDYSEVLRNINPDSKENSENRVEPASAEPARVETKEEYIKPDVAPPVEVTQAPAPVVEKDPDDLNILIVEDYAVSRKMLRIMIEKFTPWTVDEAEDGLDALKKIKVKKPDLILLDIMMPRMDGYELLQHLRAEPGTADIPVLILTGMKSPESEVKSLELGGDDYLSKPIKREILIARIRKTLSRRKLSTSKPPITEAEPKQKTVTPVEPTPKAPQKDVNASDFRLI